ncbi:DUF5689 domain-containing protein [uncultured Flavobacterium sp.]|uniref:DUF5689 domain-containing protein n=1 Tax=uncultured Flavobacterium sp. TaxID=165435 RepID=UPI0025F4413E|nr:DUF5689 domain-containing protein [uncultured Flavobacterium sp.]
MKTNFLKPIFFAAIAAGILTSCVNDDDYSVPNLECVDQNITVTKTVAEVLAQTTGSATEYTEDDVIEAYVVSSDRGGNFYKTLYLNSVDGQIGFSLQVNEVDLFSDFNVGRKVFIKLKGLYTQVRSNTLQIGALYNGNVGQIAAELYENHLIRSCESVTEASLVKKISLEDIDDTYLGKLVELDSVQFTDASLNQNYYNPSNVDGGGQTLTYITDSPEETIKLPFRTGSFAEYAGTNVSSNSGKITGILTKFNTTYQFVSRYESDINLTAERMEAGPVAPGISETAKGGTTVTFSGSFTENFETGYALNADTFPAYVNDNTVGTRYWQIKQFPQNTGNKYIEMTSFAGQNNPGVEAKTYFFVPVDFTAASTFSFQKEFRFMAGEALKVYYVTAADYTAGYTFDVADFTNITASFTGLTYPATGASQSAFTTAGTYNIPASLTGNGFFVFEYTGSSTVTTTVQIDDITIN